MQKERGLRHQKLVEAAQRSHRVAVRFLKASLGRWAPRPIRSLPTFVVEPSWSGLGELGSRPWPTHEAPGSQWAVSHAVGTWG